MTRAWQDPAAARARAAERLGDAHSALAHAHLLWHKTQEDGRCRARLAELLQVHRFIVEARWAMRRADRALRALSPRVGSVRVGSAVQGRSAADHFPVTFEGEFAAAVRAASRHLAGGELRHADRSIARDARRAARTPPRAGAFGAEGGHATLAEPTRAAFIRAVLAFAPDVPRNPAGWAYYAIGAGIEAPCATLDEWTTRRRAWADEIDRVAAGLGLRAIQGGWRTGPVLRRDRMGSRRGGAGRGEEGGEVPPAAEPSTPSPREEGGDGDAADEPSPPFRRAARA